MHRHSALLGLAMLTPALLAGCDTTTGPGASLTADEAEAVAVAIDDVSAAAIDVEGGSALRLSLSPSGPSLDVFTRTDDFAVSRDCALGGTVAVSGDRTVTIDTDAGTISAQLSATSSHDGCGIRTRQGKEIDIDGDVTLVADRELSRAGARGTHTHTGTLTYVTADGKEGTCEIDLTTELTAGDGAATRTVVGTVCGRVVDATSSWRRSGD